MSDLRPFTKNAVCPKCTGQQVFCHYARGRADCASGCPLRGQFGIEHIERRCGCCGYTWAEAPVSCCDSHDRLFLPPIGLWQPTFGTLPFPPFTPGVWYVAGHYGGRDDCFRAAHDLNQGKVVLP